MNKRKRIVPNVIRGGVAIPLGANYFYMQGNKHEAGGIDIGKDLEVENGEIIKMNPKSIKVLSDAPIMNGVSPAQMALGGLKDGTFEDRFNEGFRYQEKFKDINGLKDDGTKAIFGTEKLWESALYVPKQEQENIVSKTTPKIPLRPVNSHIEYEEELTENGTLFYKHKGKETEVPNGLKDITKEVEVGDYYLYGYDNNDNNMFYYDPETNKYYQKTYTPTDGTLDLSKLVSLSYKDFKSKLPKRDYVGGTPNESRNKMWNKIPKVKDRIVELAKQYGIDKNVLFHRLGKEGFIDHVISNYNNMTTLGQSKINDNILKTYYNPFNSFGLDYAGGLLEEGKIKLLNNINWRPVTEVNEKGIYVPSVDVDNVDNAIEIKAADMAYRQNELRKRGILEENLPMYVNAAYNLGLYHDDLKNADFIRKNYIVPNYYKLGGEMKANKSKQTIPSTGERTKAKFGLERVVSPYTENYGLTIKEPGLKLGARPGYHLDANGNYTPLYQGGSSKVSFLEANPNFLGNAITAGANIIGSTISYFNNRKMLKDLEEPVRPEYLQAAKLKTNVNIKPQVNQLRRTIDKYNRFVNRNTASSQVAAGRQRLNELSYVDNYNQLYGAKENAENQLINQDRLNQQEVAKYNLEKHNNWLDRTTDFRNNVRELQSENNVAYVQGLTGSLGNFLNNNAQWNQSMANIAALSAAYPDVTPELMNSKGLPYALWLKQRNAHRATKKIMG